MTTAVQTPAIDYAGNGVTTAFPVPFRYDAPTDLRASIEAADGTVTVLANGPGFTASPASGDSGGTLTTAAPPPAGSIVHIWRETARAQTTDYATNDTFPAASHEQALDRKSLIDQEQDREIARAVVAPRGKVPPVLDPTGLSDGDLFEFRNGRIARLDFMPFAGQFLAVDPSGRLVPASGTGTDGALRADLAAANGSGLVGASAHESLADVLGQTRRFTEAAADFSNPAAATAAIAGLLAAAGPRATVVAPAGTYQLANSSLIGMKQGQMLDLTAARFEGAGGFRIAAAEPDVSIRGGKMTGTLVTSVASVNWTDPDDPSATETETGVLVEDALRTSLSGLRISHYKKYGILIGGADFPGSTGQRGLRSHVHDVFVSDSTIGYRNKAIAGGNEYSILSASSFSSNQTGLDIGAGNQILIGVNAVDNLVNLRLRGGSANELHGVAAACQFNHARPGGFIVHGTDVRLGYTLTGCHFFGDAAGAGPIFFQRCGNIVMHGGQMDAWTFNDVVGFDTSTRFPYNYQKDMHLIGAPGSCPILDFPSSSQSGPGTKFMIRRRATGPGRLSASGITTNDPADVYAYVERASTVAFTNEDILKWNIVPAGWGDRRGVYDPLTGLFTIPQWMDGIYRLRFKAIFSMSSGGNDTDNYAEFEHNGAKAGLTLTGGRFGTGLLILQDEWIGHVAGGDTLAVRGMLIAGSGKQFGSATTGWKSWAELEMIA